MLRGGGARDHPCRRLDGYCTERAVEKWIDASRKLLLPSPTIESKESSLSTCHSVLSHRPTVVITAAPMEGEEFLTINPDTLSDRGQWRYRDLQLLCMRLSLGGR